MPALVKRLVVTAALEGLILHPAGQRTHHTTLQISYTTHQISGLGSSASPNSSASIEVHGIVGILTLTPISYLITITRREQVAQIRGVPIYVITGVALIPLSSHVEAKKVIDGVKASPEKEPVTQSSPNVDSDTSDDEEVCGDCTDEDENPASPTVPASPKERSATEPRPGGPDRSTSNVAQDVISRKGQYGRFAERWFSKKGWSTDQKRAQGMSTDDAAKPSPAPDEVKKLDKALQSAPQGESIAHTLLPKLLRTTRVLLESRSFFFSYDVDITRRLGRREKMSSELPLYKSADPLFFWNHHLIQPLIDGGHYPYILPLMQGFVGQRGFTVDEKTKSSLENVALDHENVGSKFDEQKSRQTSDQSSNFLVTLISRRSIKRSGLRYLRRGIDDEGHAANTVETEQILSQASWVSTQKVYSFTQIRGSIPLFFSQSPYSFKPVPILQHSQETNQRAFERHFANLIRRYGDVQIALLVDKKGGESEIGRRFEESSLAFNEAEVLGKKLGFEWFDFHDVCRGMKFENVNLLMKSLGPKLDDFGQTIEIGDAIERQQSGILRTNCMDCLDRTNVVQSACGQRALQKQLEEEGMEINLLTDQSTQWFNTLWADNGDQISREYSSTAALKGDFTRTRRRNYRGAINDFGLTLSRYYNNIVNDYFSQAALDFLQGTVTAQVFVEFEATLENRDPAMSMAKVRANAIETSSKIVVADQNEDLIGGWTLMSPRERNSMRTFPFDECVLLITDMALYSVKFDWNMEKVVSFERVEMQSITSIMKGTYVTSTLAATQTDPRTNVGFVVKHKAGRENITRVNTRSLSSVIESDSSEPDNSGGASQEDDKNKTSALNFLAFKALPARDSYTSLEGQETQSLSEEQVVVSVCEEIRRAAGGSGSGATDLVENGDIISVEEAKRSTGLLELWGHSLKKMVWA